MLRKLLLLKTNIRIHTQKRIKIEREIDEML